MITTNARLAAIQARAAEAIERNGAQDDATTGGGGDFKVQAAGKAKARLIGYVETGPQVQKNFPDKAAANNFVLEFQLYGKNSEGVEWVTDGDNPKPQTITTRPLTVSRNEKGNAVKLFKQMCPKKDAHHFMELLGRAFWVVIEHNTVPSKEAGKPDVVFANIKEAELKPAVKEKLDEDDNVIGYVEIAVPQPGDDDYRIYEWDKPSKEDFESLSKRQQDTLRKAKDFKNSALAALVGLGNPAATGAPVDDEPQEPVQDTPEVAQVTSVEVNTDDMPTL